MPSLPKDSTGSAGGSRTHDGGFAIGNQASENARKTEIPAETSAHCQPDADLARLIAMWPKLKKADRQFLSDWPQLSAAKRKALVAMLAAMG